MTRCTSAHNWTAYFVKIFMNPQESSTPKRFQASEWKTCGEEIHRKLGRMKKVPHLNIWHDKVGTSYHMHWMVKSKLPNDHPTPNRKSLPPVPNSKSERSETARVLIGARTYHPPRAIEQWLRPRSITKIVPKKSERFQFLVFLLHQITVTPKPWQCSIH